MSWVETQDSTQDVFWSHDECVSRRLAAVATYDYDNIESKYYRDQVVASLDDTIQGEAVKYDDVLAEPIPYEGVLADAIPCGEPDAIPYEEPDQIPHGDVLAYAISYEKPDAIPYEEPDAIPYGEEAVEDVDPIGMLMAITPQLQKGRSNISEHDDTPPKSSNAHIDTVYYTQPSFEPQPSRIIPFDKWQMLWPLTCRDNYRILYDRKSKPFNLQIYSNKDSMWHDAIAVKMTRDHADGTFYNSLLIVDWRGSDNQIRNS